MAKEAYYFSHDANARNDEKILMLMAEHGLEGYGMYWVLVEMMFESTDTCLRHDKIKGIAFANSIAMAKLQDIIDTAIAEELFVSDGVEFWSESLRRRKNKYSDLKEKRSEAGRIGAIKRWENHEKLNKTIATPKQTDSKTMANDSKGKESKVNKSKDIYSANSEFLWSLYPEKKGKQTSIKKLPALIKEHGKEQMERTIQRYMDEVENKRKNGFPELNYVNGSTFFNGRYEDYLDDNYQKPVTYQEPQPDYFKPLTYEYED